MNKMTRELLKISAKVGEKLAIKSCGATSLVDSYQPKIPAAVRELKESAALQNQKK